MIAWNNAGRIPVVAAKGRETIVASVSSLNYDVDPTILLSLFYKTRTQHLLNRRFSSGYCGGSKKNSFASKALSSSASSFLAPQVMGNSYKDYSIHQYSAHDGCRNMLEACMERWGRRLEFLGQNIIMDDNDMSFRQRRRRRFHLADLGSADGSSTLRTLQHVLIPTLKSHTTATTATTTLPPLHLILEEHPSSDGQILETTIKERKEWLDSCNMTYSIMLQSFYEPLFESESMDFIMSYTSLHWLHTADQNHPLETWKYLHQTNEERCLEKDIVPSFSSSSFVSVQEAQAPKALKDEWKELACQHLAHFLLLRSQELRPGSEMMLMMVAHPHEFILPPTSSERRRRRRQQRPNRPCALTLALQQSVEDGTVRSQILERALIPYYLREPEDIRLALQRANEDENGGLLELVDMKHYETFTPTDTFERNLAAAQLFWSIHGALVKVAGATEDELIAVESKLPLIFDDLYGEKQGFRGVFLAVVLRKRTRKPWTG